MVDVLPAPFGPRTAVTSPASALNVTPSTAVTDPKRTTSSSMTTAAVTFRHATVAAVMIDIRLVRSEPETVRAALERRGRGVGDTVDVLAGLDVRARELGGERDAARAEIRKLSQEVAAARKLGDE